MAIAVSEAFKDAVDDVHKIVVVEEVTLRRRKKASGFPYEVSAVTLDEEDFKRTSPITKKYDVQKQNKILVSNLTLTLDNRDFQWDEFNNTLGRWRPDVDSALGYDPYLSEFTVKFGVKVSSDVDVDPEIVQIFTGRATDYVQDSKSGTIQIFLRGFEIKRSDLRPSGTRRLRLTLTQASSLGF